MFFGRESFAISMTFGVLGIKSLNLYVTVSIVAPKNVKKEVMEAIEKLGTPMTPEFYRPLSAICDPIPTKVPEMMSLMVDIFLR